MSEPWEQEGMFLAALLFAFVSILAFPWYAWNKRFAWRTAMAKRRAAIKSRVARERQEWLAIKRGGYDASTNS